MQSQYQYQSPSSVPSGNNGNGLKQLPRGKISKIPPYDNRKDEDQVEELAEYFAIFKATEMLEVAYSRDAVPANEYADACSRLISQYKAINASLTSAGLITDPLSFLRQYQIDCPRAYDRLVRDGVPATVMHGVNDNKRSEVKIAAECVQAFITAMDALRLGQRATDEIQPLISELTASLNKVTGLPPTFMGLSKIKGWLQKLHSLRASDEIQDEDARQLTLDLENAYHEFHAYL